MTENSLVQILRREEETEHCQKILVHQFFFIIVPEYSLSVSTPSLQDDPKAMLSPEDVEGQIMMFLKTCSVFNGPSGIFLKKNILYIE